MTEDFERVSSGIRVSDRPGSAERPRHQSISVSEPEPQTETLLAEALRSAGDKLTSMAEQAERRCAVSDAARRVSQLTRRGADWLDSGGAATMLHQVRGYAGRSPLGFVAMATVSGLILGRVRRRAAIRRCQRSIQFFDGGLRP